MGTAIKHPVPGRVKPSFAILDIRTLWCSAPCIECPDVKNYEWRLNPAWHRMLYIMATVGVKGLTEREGGIVKRPEAGNASDSGSVSSIRARGGRELQWRCREKSRSSNTNKSPILGCAATDICTQTTSQHTAYNKYTLDREQRSTQNHARPRMQQSVNKSSALNHFNIRCSRAGKTLKDNNNLATFTI